MQPLTWQQQCGARLQRERQASKGGEGTQGQQAGAVIHLGPQG